MRDEVKNAILNAPDDQVDLGEMAIRNDELEEIFALLANARTNITELFLNNNHISDEGAAALTNGLALLHKLKKVDLQFNQIGINGFTTLYEKELNIKFAVHGNKVVDHAELAAVKKSSFKL